MAFPSCHTFNAMKSHKVKDAQARVERAQLKRDSVSRKMCAGSESVSAKLLAEWDSEVEAAKADLDRLLSA